MHAALHLVPALACGLGAILFGLTTGQDWPHVRTQDRAAGVVITLALATGAAISAQPVLAWIGGIFA